MFVERRKIIVTATCINFHGQHWQKIDLEGEERAGYHPAAAPKEVCLKDIKNQVIAVNLGCLHNMHGGMNLVYSNLIIQEFDRNTISWFASIIGLAIPVGAVACGLIVDKFGRKATTLAVLVPCIVCWFLMYQARLDQIYLLYFSRFLSGFSAGLGCVSAIYVSEISHAKYRAAFSGLLPLHGSLGILFISVLHIFCTWQQTALICSLVFAVFLVLSFCYLSESPVWLAKIKSDPDGAKRTLRWLISDDEIFEKEWISLSESTKLEQQPARSFNICQPYIYKPMTILLVIFLLQQCTGNYLITAYVVDIFPRLCPSLGPQFNHKIFILFGVLRLVSTILGTLLSMKVDRKPLLVWSNISTFVACFLIVVIAKLYYVDPSSAENGQHLSEWIVMALFLWYIFTTSIGILIVPWSLNSDLWPTEARGTGGAIISAFGFLIFFAFSKAFPFAVEETGILVMFQIFGISCLLMATYSQIFVPVTLDKSFQEIQQHFTKKNVVC